MQSTRCATRCFYAVPISRSGISRCCWALMHGCRSYIFTAYRRLSHIGSSFTVHATMDFRRYFEDFIIAACWRVVADDETMTPRTISSWAFISHGKSARFGRSREPYVQRPRCTSQMIRPMSISDLTLTSMAVDNTAGGEPLGSFTVPRDYGMLAGEDDIIWLALRANKITAFQVMSAARLRLVVVMAMRLFAIEYSPPDIRRVQGDGTSTFRHRRLRFRTLIFLAETACTRYGFSPSRYTWRRVCTMPLRASLYRSIAR